MKRKTSLIPLILAASSVFVTRTASAQSVNSDYTTKLGDSCVGIAVKAYGDRRGVELIHKANPSMGALPHNLKPGTVLHLPPAEKLGNGPDARVTFVRNKVTVQAQSTKSAEVNDPLFRTNRVSTANASSANVVFRDETQVRVGEESLVIILGDVQGAARKQAADATLVSGSLQARLAELSGKRPLTVDTSGGARVTLPKGEAHVSVDSAKSTRLAVHKGDANLSASQKTVAVPSGFGSKAEAGKAPTAPRPLPSPPTWAVVPKEVLFTDSSGTADVVAKVTDAGGAGKPAAAQFRVQLARDSRFDDLITDVVVPKVVNTVEARKLAPGAYFFRVSAIDDDKFESAPGPTAKLVVTKTVLAETSPGRAKLTLEPSSGLVCRIDGGALRQDLPEVDSSRAHELGCALAPSDPFARGADVAGALGVSTIASLQKPFVLNASFRESKANEGYGIVAIELVDGSGKPVSAEGATATASNGVTVEEVRASGSTALVKVRFPATARPFVITIKKGDLGVESNLLRIPSPNDPRASGNGTPVDASPGMRERGFEVALSVGFDQLLSNHVGHHATLATGYRLPLGSSVALSVGPSVTLARYEPRPTSPDGFDPAPLGDVSDHVDLHIGLPLAFRLRPRRAVQPYAVVAPELAVQRATFATGTSRVSSTGTLLGARFALGAQVEGGPGWLFAELGVRASGVVAKDPAAESLSAATLDLGYRFSR